MADNTSTNSVEAPSTSDAAAISNPSNSTTSKNRAAMDSNNLKTLMLLLPKLPLIVRVAVMHVLGQSESAKYLDLRSDLIVSVLRSFMEPSPTKPRTISAVQKMTLRDPGPKGRIWVSTYASPTPPETSIRDELLQAVESMRDPDLPGSGFKIPEIDPVEAEWTGYRAGAGPEDTLPNLSQKAMYDAMMEECSQPTTVLYLHGGAYYLCDPSTHRAAVKKLAKLTGGRCYSVRYRLAPQHPFPAAVLDALLSYFTLLYPPPDAYHEPVKPEHIIIAGDSAGGNLALALLQLLLEFNRNNTTILWHGETRKVPMPAAVTLNSPWLDITQSSPSWEGDAPEPFDYLPKPEIVDKGVLKDCDIWPAQPPRKHLYVDDDLIAHPLASVVMSRSWEGSPPVYICTGWEILALEDKYFAKKLRAQGVPVVFEEYEAMPHCFAMILERIPSARRCFDGWAAFIKKAVKEPGTVESRAVEIKAKTLEEIDLDFETLSDFTEETIRGRVEAKAVMLKVQDRTAKL